MVRVLLTEADGVVHPLGGSLGGVGSVGVQLGNLSIQHDRVGASDDASVGASDGRVASADGAVSMAGTGDGSADEPGVGAASQSQAVGLQVRTLRNRNIVLPEEVQDAIDRYSSDGMECEPFGDGRSFASSAEFLSEWTRYEHATMTQFQSRASDKAAAANRRKIAKQVKDDLPVDEVFLGTLIPERLGHAVITRRCKHGVYKQSRGGGKRKRKTTVYLACPARISAIAKCEAGKWSFVTQNEICIHNHQCTQSMLDSYGASALLTSPEMTKNVSVLLQAGASPANVCDTISANYGIKITPKQIANIRRDRLGGQSAVKNLKLLLQRFASFPGSRCLVVDDQNGQVCAIVMQSAAQREMFRLFGDNLVMDWTHNTNNLGFYLGSLMVTSVTGRGVSVCDFLCVEQTEAMMSTVLEYFIEVNPGAVDKVKSVVIDKDYKEWRVLERLFVKSTVLLCQFHALRWFGQVVTVRKYNLSIAVRDDVLRILTAMVYAKTTTTFDVLRADLDRLLRETSPSFLLYMKERWYSCRSMWSDCERSAVFTALNTTTNRIESAWNQVKKVLGKKLRIDLCVESIFAYQTAVLRREISIISKYKNALILRSETDRFIRASMAEVCEFASEKVSKEWDQYILHDTGSKDEYICWPVDSSFKVTRPDAAAATYSVDPGLLSCTCDFAVTAALPCRHALYVARRVLQLPQLPTDAVSDRWRMKNAFPALTTLETNVAEIQSLRTALLLTDGVFSRLIEPDFLELADNRATPFRRVAYRRLRRHEECDVVVFNNIEKRNILEAELERVIQFLMLQSTPQFMRLASELKELVAARLKKWMKELNSGADNAGASCTDSVSEVNASIASSAGDANVVDDEIAAAMAADEERFYDADASQRREDIRRGDRKSDSACAAPVGEAQTMGREIASAACVATTYEPVQEAVKTTPAPLPMPDVLKDTQHHAVPRTQSFDDDLLAMVQSDDDGFDPAMSPFSSPRTAESRRRTSPCAVTCPTPPTANAGGMSALLNPIVAETEDDSLSVTSSEVSSFVRRVAEHQHPIEHQRPASMYSDASKSVASSDMSELMHRVAEHQLRTDAPTTRPPRSKAPVPQASRTLDAAWVRGLIDPDDHSPGVLDGATVVRVHAGPEVGILGKRTLPRRNVVGQVKKQKTTSGATGRSTFTEQDSTLPGELWNVTQALRNTRDLVRVADLWKMTPRRFDSEWLFESDVTVDVKSFWSSDYAVNFRAKRKFVKKLQDELEGAVRNPQSVSNTAEDPVDLTGGRAHRKHDLVTQAVVSFGGQVRAFSVDNIKDFEEYFKVYDLCGTYKADVLWLQEGGGSLEYDVPYPQYVRLRGVQADILAEMKTATLSTTFRIRTEESDLQMAITMTEILGFLAQSSRLNDCVLLYGLRQLAADYENVCVAECLPGQRSTPVLSFERARWILFPQNFSKVHWGIIVAEMDAGEVVNVWVYDPLQCLYVDKLKGIWATTCKSFLQSWADRDGVEFVAAREVRVVKTNTQHDSDSCGVYCIGIAIDLLTGTPYFSTRKDDQEEAISQLRVRLMWRIFCDSLRVDDPDEEEEARRVTALVEYSAEDKQKTTIARANLSSIKRSRSWRE